MAKLENKLKYLLTLIVPFFGTTVMAQDSEEPKSGGSSAEAEGSLSAGAIAAAVAAAAAIAAVMDDDDDDGPAPTPARGVASRHSRRVPD